MQLRTLTPTAIAHKTVLVRVDFNVPTQKTQSGWVVTDDNRIQASLRTINFLLKHQAKVVLVTHLGRPPQTPSSLTQKSGFSTQLLIPTLTKLLNHPVEYVNDCVGPAVQSAIAAAQPGQVMLLENIRFYPEEEANDSQFAHQLAQLAQVYVNEAFSTAHRCHASTEGVTHHLPSLAGFAFAEEVAALNQLMTKPKRPFVLVIGGAKISDKIAAIKNLTTLADSILVGGGVANNFLKAEGFNVAHSYLEDTPVDHKKHHQSYIAAAEQLLESTQYDRLLLHEYLPLPKILYPLDVYAANSMTATHSTLIELSSSQHEQAVKNNQMFLDIGPKTQRLFSEVIKAAGTIFWNGPMGVFENPTFARGTHHIAQAIAESHATTILGGGDTISAIHHFKLEGKYSYVSAAGGAALDFLAGHSLPGVKPLLEKQ